MLHQFDSFNFITHFHELTEELSAGLDPDFDAAHDDLEREFQELRCQLGHFMSGR